MKRILLMVLFLGAVAGARACGPWLPERTLTEPDRFARCTPAFHFDESVARFAGPSTKSAVLPEGEKTARQQTAETEAAELAEALDAAGARGAARERTLREAAAFRRVLEENGLPWLARNEASEVERVYWKARRDAVGALAIPAGLPGEFGLYLCAAQAYHQGKFEEARKEAQKLLGLPEAQRRRRSTWAAFLLGKSWMAENHPEEAAREFARVRELAKRGFDDRLGLATCSLGWQAMAEWTLGREERAAALYLEQARAGDPSGVDSLRTVAGWVLAADASPARLAKAARDPLLRQVVTAWVNWLAPWEPGNARPEAAGPAQQWLRAVEAAKLARVEGAEGLAWAAYQVGDLDAAGRWLRAAPSDGMLALWLRGKLALREGKLPEAAGLLAKACRAFPAAQRRAEVGAYETDTSLWSHLRGEEALVHLARARFLEALDTFLQADFWEDAAWLSERVLTVEELKGYVDRCCPEGKLPPSVRASSDLGVPRGDLRWLLGRRLARLGRLDEARAYLPEGERGVLADYEASLRRGRDPGLPPRERGTALWRAARIARHQGLEIMGTEVEPDWRVYSGDLEWGDVTVSRLTNAPSATRFASSAEEKTRIKNHLVRPEKRWHYRYVAADLAWQAAALLPDGDEATATVLCAAGSWIKNRDEKAADRFYQALVRRCPRTALGREAERIRWFPKVREENP